MRVISFIYREKEFEAAEKLHFSILGLLNERDNFPSSSKGYSKLSVQLRQSLNQLYSQIQNLRAHLSQQSASHLTVREKERRSLQVEDIFNKYRKLQDSVNSSIAIKNQLIGGQNSEMNPSVSTMDNEHIPHRELRQMQTQVMDQQDRGLEELSKIIGRQRQMAQAIGEEVESQNDLIDNIADNVDRTRDRLAQQTTQITLTDRKDRTCGYWIVILSLFVAIVIVAAIPKP